jgi:hypothetical protein
VEFLGHRDGVAKVSKLHLIPGRGGVGKSGQGPVLAGGNDAEGKSRRTAAARHGS